MNILDIAIANSNIKKSLLGSGAIKGKDGFSPIITENHENTERIYRLDITTKAGMFTTPNLKCPNSDIVNIATDREVYDYIDSLGIFDD